MDHTEDHSEKGSPWRFVFWVGLLVMAYLVSSGPMTRWQPAIADKIYAPLSPLANSKMLGPAMHKWLSLWGVK